MFRRRWSWHRCFAEAETWRRDFAAPAAALLPGSMPASGARVKIARYEEQPNLIQDFLAPPAAAARAAPFEKTAWLQRRDRNAEFKPTGDGAGFNVGA